MRWAIWAATTKDIGNNHMGIDHKTLTRGFGELTVFLPQQAGLKSDPAERTAVSRVQRFGWVAQLGRR